MFTATHQTGAVEPDREKFAKLGLSLPPNLPAPANWTDIPSHNPFSFDRTDIAILEPKAPPPPPAPKIPVGPKPVLFGTLSIGKEPMALIGPGKPGNRDYKPMMVGEIIDGWTLVSISDKSVVMKGNDVQETIAMNDPTAQIPREHTRTEVAPAPVVTSTGGLAPPATPAEPQRPDDIVPISLHLDNADIYQVIHIIADNLALNYIIDPGIKGTVNINTSGTLRRSDLLPILETLLKINGATMVKVGNFYQILPTPSAIRQPLPVIQANQAPGDDQIVIQIVRMKFVAASEMARLLTPYLSEGANIVTHDAGNILLISERRSNLRKLLELVDVFDSKVFEGDRVRLFPVKNNLVRDLINDLKSVFAGYGLSETGGAIRFLPLERMNSILVVTGNPEIFAEVDRWIARLDQPLATAGFRNYVYRVRNSKASDLQSVLQNLYGRFGTPAANLPGQQPAAQAAPAQAAAPFPAAPATP